MKKIFVIEDDQNIGEVFSLILNEHYLAKIVDNVGDVVGRLEFFKPDLIILDHWIGEVQLKELVEQLKCHPQLNEVPFILTSTQISLAQVAESLGAKAYLPKPFDLEELLTLIAGIEL